MTVAIRCNSCGKIFNIKENDDGGIIRCRVCDAEVDTSSARLGLAPAGQTEQTEEIGLVDLEDPGTRYTSRTQSGAGQTGSNSSTVEQGATIECKFCAEKIPAISSFCPLCGSKVSAMLTSVDEDTVLAEISKDLSEKKQVLIEEESKKSLIRLSTIVLGMICALAIAIIVLGSGMNNNDGDSVIVLGVINLIIFGIAFLVSISRNYRSIHINDSKDAALAFYRYWDAIYHGRGGYAYRAVVPGCGEKA